MKMRREHVRRHASRVGVLFDRVSDWTIRATGTAPAFVVALASVLIWLSFAPFVGFGNTNYQLAINTSTTIVTFLMIFLVQNAQNRSARHDEEMRKRMERMEREHGAELAALRELVTDLHSHTTCKGHTTIGGAPGQPASQVNDGTASPSQQASRVPQPPSRALSGSAVAFKAQKGAVIPPVRRKKA